MIEIRPNIPEPQKWGTRSKPVTGEEMYECAKWIKTTCTAHKVNGVLLDLFSASALCGVADKLNAPNRAKLLSLPIYEAVTLCFKVIGG